MIFDLDTVFSIINIFISLSFVLGCVFLMLTLNKAISKEKNLITKLSYYGLIFSSSLILLRTIVFAVMTPIDSIKTVILLYSVEIVLSAIVGVLMIVCIIRIRSGLPELDPFQLQEVKEGKIDQNRIETVHPSVVYDPINSKPEVAFCVNCGQRIEYDSKFCVSCGVNIERE